MQKSKLQKYSLGGFGIGVRNVGAKDELAVAAQLVDDLRQPLEIIGSAAGYAMGHADHGEGVNAENEPGGRCVHYPLM